MNIRISTEHFSEKFVGIMNSLGINNTIDAELFLDRCYPSLRIGTIRVKELKNELNTFFDNYSDSRSNIILII